MFRVIDLTMPITETSFVVTEESGYTDPPIKFESWATIEDKGYAVTALHMSGHVGTHCDASSHYVKTGRTISDIDAATFIGWAVVLDFTGQGQIDSGKLSPYTDRVKGRDDVVIVLRNTKNDSLTDSGRRTLASWQPKVIVTGDGWDIDINYHDSDFFHRADVPLIMRPNPTAVAEVRDGDLIVGLPILLDGREASPVRLVAIRGLAERVGGGGEEVPRTAGLRRTRFLWWRRK